MRKRARVPLQQYKQLFLYSAILLIGIGMGLIAVSWVDEQQCGVAKTALEQAVAGTLDCKQVFSTSAWGSCETGSLDLAGRIFSVFHGS